METKTEKPGQSGSPEMAERSRKMMKKASLGVFCEEVVDAAMTVEESIQPLRRVFLRGLCTFLG